MVNAETAMALASEKVWHDKLSYEDAEVKYQEQLAKKSSSTSKPSSNSVVAEIIKARDQIKSSLAAVGQVPSSGASINPDLNKRIQDLENENAALKKVTDELRSLVLSLDSRVKAMEESKTTATPAAAKIIPAPAAAKPAANDDDDDVDLFGSDEEEDEEAEKIKQERVAAYAAKKSKKPALIAKSNIILDIKPWDDETDMAEMERQVRLIVADGLLWGTAKLVPLAYGIKKLQISTVVEDDKVSVDWLIETIQELEDLVQSVDIAAFNKI